MWDWNGTLLDDLPLVVESVNVLMERQGLEPITVADYTSTYTRPVRRFYERLFGRSIGDEEWVELDRVFHEAYDEVVADHATLMDGATDALAAVAAAGMTQSLLSMYRHDPLLGLLDHFGIRGRFEHVQGITGEGGGRKLPHLEAHLRTTIHLHGDDPSGVLLIGDAVDDAVAASHVGAACVLLASGSHPLDELRGTGVPVVSTIAEALVVGGVV